MILKKKEDERGWLVEVFRNELKEGQVYFFTINPGYTRGNHYHTKKKEWFCLLRGEATLYLDNKPHKMVPLEKVYIPKNKIHKVINTGKKECIMIAFTNKKFDKNNPDTYFPKEKK